MINKHIVLGITGGIAAFKAASLVTSLNKQGYEVQVLMTKSACEFITPLTFETLTKKKVYVDVFDKSEDVLVHHIEIAKWADLFVVAPATANTIAKMANGFADDMLTSSFLASTCPKLIVPSMNTHMLENAMTQENLKKLVSYGISVMESDTGLLACGDVGKGKFPESEAIIEEMERLLVREKDLLGKTVLISAGPTLEALDPVRYLSNHSSGKMGYALAKEARNRGAKVYLVSGPVRLGQPKDMEVIPVQSAKEMADAVFSHFEQADITIMVAAVADYRPLEIKEEKIKKQDSTWTLTLERTTDILATLGEKKKATQILVGFAMETENLLENAQAKLMKKNCDYLVANSIREVGSGFAGDTNHGYILSKSTQVDLGLLTKKELAKKIIDQISKGD
ncbi:MULTISPECIES: bifunctional phosphopantothenoylcysteine decarboxylase/phosphopantothenate--cysteine ligase CoaBC [Terrabacteria group]|uniref:bifunctional phosphopantothenoylcysteine decarboxylase/phosphopantothenate--cysteine ligase CoaBC n=1 Tax=Bacillati TaxID=1783272 RepID=UPI001C6F074A|nr:MULTISPECIES: bifunctional phosphopantothenoylcysteine decarboxylase/phosphopantothenate--cysteine ligase CoaBC [Terrabacteria group]MBW9212217.1 bifunctional phosphopantothenoylcysteine decarboxylase/phosphopantothenate--cysteine ligase CoaBC [Trueperella sp. zg.1013]